MSDQYVGKLKFASSEEYVRFSDILRRKKRGNPTGPAAACAIGHVGQRATLALLASLAALRSGLPAAQATLDKPAFLEASIGPGRRVTAVRCLRPDGAEGIATGRSFVIFAHAVETPKLLLMSKSGAAPG